MAKVDFIRARVEPATKHKAEAIFKKLGLSISEAINIFYNQVILNKGLPFEVKIPNELTLRVMKETEEEKNLTKWKSSDDFVKEMERRSSEK
ncbi:MAG: type II toxin-antitoxin system RelB/DinJ family antitoxin [Proteobacteria bacterium]|nr:type II toxin-antitoxin system RelB/DinJ family antitoxin [Pseudomonadota bacterium]